MFSRNDMSSSCSNISLLLNTFFPPLFGLFPTVPVHRKFQYNNPLVVGLNQIYIYALCTALNTYNKLSRHIYSHCFSVLSGLTSLSTTCLLVDEGIRLSGSLVQKYHIVGTVQVVKVLQSNVMHNMFSCHNTVGFRRFIRCVFNVHNAVISGPSRPRAITIYYNIPFTAYGMDIGYILKSAQFLALFFG